MRNVPWNLLAFIVLFAVCGAGCSFAARSADVYQRDTRKVLMRKSSQMTDCYEAVREKDDTAQGIVTVAFKVESDSGKLVNPKIVEKSTTAGPDVQECVLAALGGLALEPADARDGEATFSWEFGVKE